MPWGFFADPRIVEAFERRDPSRVIQPIAETIRVTTGTSYVVVMNMDAIRAGRRDPFDRPDQDGLAVGRDFCYEGQ